MRISIDGNYFQRKRFLHTSEGYLKKNDSNGGKNMKEDPLCFADASHI